MKSITPRFKLPRRTFLRGLAGMAVGLPVLECMLDGNGQMLAGKHFDGRAHAQAATFPKRYAVVFAGQAIGGDGFAEDSYRIGDTVTTDPTMRHFIVPPQENTATYDVTTPLLPLEDAGLLGDVSLVSGLRIPHTDFNTPADDTDNIPAGGAYRDFHGGGCSPLLSGTASTSASFTCNGPSSDQVIAQLNAGQTNLPSLVVRSQPVFYINGFDFAGREFISYSGPGQRIVAQDNPGNAWSSLFSNFAPEGDAPIAIHNYTQRKRLSVLDLVQRKRERLLGRVGAADRVRLERHFDELRNLELRVQAIPPLTGEGCTVPPNPGTDWPVGGDNAGSGAGEIQPNTGYSDEETRSQLYVDMIHMAFTCDLTRAATLQITAFQSHMNVIPIVDLVAPRAGFPGLSLRADLHEVGHNGDGESKGQLQVSLMLMWHMRHYARLLQKLKDTPEGAGTVLDNSAIVFMPEAGHGIQLNDGGATDNATHSVDRMVLLVGGRAGGLAPGRHLATGGAVHPAQVLLAAMQGCGYGSNTFGDVTGAYTDLFG